MTMKKINFDLRDKWATQGVKANELREKFDTKMTLAMTLLQDLKSQKSTLLKREFEGADMSKEKAAIDAKLNDAIRDLEEAEAERTAAYEHASELSATNHVSVRDMVVNWNGSHRTMVRDVQLLPIQKQMAAARSAYLNAIIDMRELRQTYADDYSKLHSLNYRDHRPGDNVSLHEIANYVDLPSITNAEIIDAMDYGRLPADIERTVIGGEK
ncbi:hypothetical protein GCM10008018_60380 [Paenibacillus marchantiophytorum]|uniref:Phage protein n=1 Tax=Paenibacillus marchantiophytorum TaxID=1619310 RepID=A0ABQ1FC84_9BACL|nr:hypothetical protein [Paenibacillus marchantiophytorum]GGA06441.1 hypothetical protein GCM10008018_60380 [Paenibacillus marchantiophytorum]